MFESGQDEGKTDRQIYTELHPMGEEITYGLPLDALHCEQLCQIANQLLEQELPSLHDSLRATSSLLSAPEIPQLLPDLSHAARTLASVC